jgi:hypothetical protein
MLRIRIPNRAVLAVLALFGVLLATPADAQNAPLGPNFIVNRMADSSLTGARYTDVSWDSVNHVYLVIWGAFGRVMGRFVAPDGALIGNEPFVIAAPLNESDYRDGPRVAYSPETASFMVVWRDDRVDPDSPQVWGRSVQYQGSSAPLFGAEFPVTTQFVSSTDTPTVEYSTGSHLFLVVFQSGANVRGQRVSTDGTLIGSEIPIAVSGDLEWMPSLAYNPNADEFYVVWRFYSDPLMAGSIQGRRVAASSGSVLGTAVDLEPMTGFDLAVPAVAFDAASNRYLAVWYKAPGSFTIQGRLINADGTPAGNRFTVSPTGVFSDLDVTYSSRTGTYLVVFPHHDILEIFGAGVTAAGTPDPIFQVSNTSSTTGTDYSRIAAATDRDEWLVSHNIWWDRALGQRVAFSGSAVTFSKQTPWAGASGLPSNVTFTWDAVPGATGYEICIDSTQDNQCDTAWTNAATPYSRTLVDGVYNWQVRALTGSGAVAANAGGWWTLTVGGSAGAPGSGPGKVSPTNGASSLGTSVTLSWNAVTSSTYQVCVDQVNDNSCNASWVDVSTTSTMKTLANGTYYWQVRGQVDGNWVLGDSGGSWSFTVGAAPAPSLPFDFTGDRKADVLWRHTSTGQVWLWPMNGAAPLSQSFVRTVSDTNWEIRGMGDQNGDGKADILWRNKVTGAISYWPMNGSVPVSETYVTSVDPAYDIVGTGDYNGDGKSDILWRNATNGQVWIWLMDGAATLSSVHVDTVDPIYRIDGSGDLDGDGKSDIVWRNTSTGDVWVWLMNGTTRLSQTMVGAVPDLSYQIQGVADFTGDGKADILWRHTTQGHAWIWPMNGAVLVSQTFVATVDPVYVIKANGDYDGDGKADILWHHSTVGDVWVWLMNGTTMQSQTLVGKVPDVGYQIVKVR